MSEFQTLLALVVLIFVLSVIVQAIQEVIKSFLDTKAKTMKETIEKFMGAHLTLPQVESALRTRGLDITALENFHKEDFRHLLDGIELAQPQIEGLVASANATAGQAKDNIAGAFEAARASFQKAYTSKNKIFAIVISFVVVLALNASIIKLYEMLGENQTLSQAIAGTASTISSRSGQNPTSQDLAATYSTNRTAITQDLQKYPILFRTRYYGCDWSESKFNEIVGLLVMGILVSLGAPFWNDIMKGMMGVNNALNSNGQRST